jgi:hypothetical protein
VAYSLIFLSTTPPSDGGILADIFIDYTAVRWRHTRWYFYRLHRLRMEAYSLIFLSTTQPSDGGILADIFIDYTAIRSWHIHWHSVQNVLSSRLPNKIVNTSI